MKFAGFIKTSMVDDAPNISAVVFTKGCNMSCAYCHNLALCEQQVMIDEEEVLAHLYKRQGVLDSLVVSGGEPTLHKALPKFLMKVKALGYRVKLDTNGTNAQMLKVLIHNELIDYVAMDIKGTESDYQQVCGCSYSEVREAIDLLRGFGNYEFRTTLYPYTTLESYEQLLKTYSQDNYYLQQYRKNSHDALEPFEEGCVVQLADEYNVPLRGIVS